jgi:D-xylose transport system ATP-binding protein
MMPGSEQAIARCVGITKYFGGVRALSDVSLDLYPGEVVCLIGDNGAGKSTLTRVIGGLLKPDAGELWIGNDRMHRLSPDRARALGIETVAQNLNLCDNLDAATNVMLGQEPHRWAIGPIRIVDREQSRRVARMKIDEVGVHLGDLLMPIRRLSGGQRQAIAIARALVRGHRLVIFDEPTAALGVRQRHTTLALIKRVARENVSVVVVSHNVDDVFEVAHRVVALRLGRIILDAPVAAVTRDEVLERMAGNLPGERVETGRTP